MEFGVRVCVHQRSVIIVLEALSMEFRTGCPWDDLMISAGSMSNEELLVSL